MPRSFRLLTAVALLATAGCAGEPTMPASRPALAPPATVQVDSLSDANANGGCRSGYTLTNGMCTPI